MGKCSKHAYSCLPFRLDLTAMVVVVMHVPAASRCLPVQLDLTVMGVVVMHVAAAPKHGLMLSVLPYRSVLFSLAIAVSETPVYL
jgi:hypothetical protein